MTRNLLIGATALTLLASLIPVTAYHIDGVAGAGGLTAADWVSDTTGVTLCESAGALDDRNDAPVDHFGVNGLCTTGQNDATGSTQAATPTAGTYVKLDVCDALTGLAPVGRGAGSACSAGKSLSLLSANPGVTSGRTDVHGFSATVGAFTCFVPTNMESLPIANVDYALYYDELYADWSYTGSPATAPDIPDERIPYTPGDAVGATMTGDGSSGLVNVLANEDAFHGHATVRPDLSASEPGATHFGSVETSAGTLPAGTTLSDDSSQSSGGLDNDCGGSPACGSDAVTATTGTTCTTMYGPVVRAPSGNAGVNVAERGLLCMDLWDGLVWHHYPCLNPVTCVPGLPTAVATVVVNVPVLAGFAPTQVGQTYTGFEQCGGVTVASATALMASVGPIEVGVAPGVGAQSLGAETCNHGAAGDTLAPNGWDLILVKCVP